MIPGIVAVVGVVLIVLGVVLEDCGFLVLLGMILAFTAELVWIWNFWEEK